MFKKVEMWLVILVCLIMFIAQILSNSLIIDHYTGGKNFKTLKKIIFYIAEVPINLKEIFNISKRNESISKIDKAKLKEINSTSNFIKNDHKKGYILTSVFSPKIGSTKTVLIDLTDEKIFKEWQIDFNDLENKTKFKIIPKIFRSQHPLLLSDGSIVITEGEGPMVNISRCNEINWVLDKHTHHAINKIDDKNLIINTVKYDNNFSYMSEFDKKKIANMENNLRDDSFSYFNLDKKKVTQEFSLIKIFHDNNLLYHIYNHENLLFKDKLLENLKNNINIRTDKKYDLDIFHLNDAEYINKEDGILKKGDIILSLRNLNMVLIYRPSNNKVIKYKIGPWTHQHDVEYRNGKIFIFGNDNLMSNKRTRKSSSIYTWHLQSEQVNTLLNLDDPVASGGLYEILDDNEILIDIGNKIYIYQIKPKKLIMEFIFKYSKKYSLQMHWARYYADEEIDLSKLQCSK